MSKSHTQFCQADSYCSSATCKESRMYGSWEKSVQPWTWLTTCARYYKSQEQNMTMTQQRHWSGHMEWLWGWCGGKECKGMKEDVNGEEKTPRKTSRKCYNLTNHILWSKIHKACLLPYLCYIFLTISLTSAAACGFSDDRPFRYILITWSRPKFFIDWKTDASVNEH